MRDQGFYSTAAQVIPVLLLALAFERRYFREDEDEASWESLWMLAMLVAMGAGELLAVLVLFDDSHPTLLDKVVVIAAITWGVMVLIMPLLRPRLKALATTLPPKLVSAVRLGWFPALLVVVGLCYVFDPGLVLSAAMAALVLGLVLISQVASWREGRGDD